ncbi:MAG: hypothetical protein GC157_02340 [Frankiales bacterium]|nr:hypothetical protein [Frankiales bacterium]
MRARPVRLMRRLPSRLPGRSAVALGALGAVLLAGHLVAAPTDGASALPASGMLEESDAAQPDPLRVGDDLVLAATFRPVLTSVTAARLVSSARSRPGATPAARPAAAPATARSAQAAGATRSRSGPRPFYARLPVLRVGSTGTWVTAVQRKLGVSRTGYFGPLTRAAVSRFQAAHGLPRVGQVGPLTWKALLATRAPSARRAPATRTTAPRPAAPASPVVAGRICPAPGAAFGQGWGAPRAGHSHQGQDLMGRRGSPILAIEDAVVIREGR